MNRVTRTSRTWLALIIVGVVWAVVFWLTPVGAHVTQSLSHLYKHADPRYVQETELFRYGPIELNMGQSRNVRTFGPFTLTARCFDSGGPQSEILIDTSADNSAVRGFQTDHDFDAADPAVQWLLMDSTQPTQELQPGAGFNGNAYAVSQSGTFIHGTATTVFNFGGFDCVFFGWIMRTAP